MQIYIVTVLGVIGAIDGCNIPFKAPHSQQDSYIDKNDNHSIKFQAIATASKIFTNLNIGYPGSVHDARVKLYYVMFIKIILCSYIFQVFCNSHIFVEMRNHPLTYFPTEFPFSW